jgi:prepilin peptidase CpaA
MDRFLIIVKVGSQGGAHLIVVLIVFMIAAFIWDIRKKIIPNQLTFSMLGCGLILNLVMNGVNGLFFSSIGAIIGFLLTYTLYALKAIGGGDVKLFAGIGAMNGTMFMFDTLVYSILFAACVGLVIFIKNLQIRNIIGILYLTIVKLKFTSSYIQVKELIPMKSTTIPFMIVVLPAVCISWINNIT